MNPFLIHDELWKSGIRKITVHRSISPFNVKTRFRRQHQYIGAYQEQLVRTLTEISRIIELIGFLWTAFVSLSFGDKLDGINALVAVRKVGIPPGMLRRMRRSGMRPKLLDGDEEETEQ